MLTKDDIQRDTVCSSSVCTLMQTDVVSGNLNNI